MINIDKSSFFGKGHHRECYVHPEDKNLCIKIVVDGNHNSPQMLREKQYYKHLENRNICWDMLPKYYGDVKTNLGIGSVFDLVLDHDGQVAKTLEYYLGNIEETKANYAELSQCFIKFKDYLFTQRIITSRLEPRNITCQRDASGIIRLSIIDNIGNSDFLPISNYSKYFAKKKITRRWDRFKKDLLKYYPDNQELKNLLSDNNL